MERLYEVQRENRIFAEIERLRRREKELLDYIKNLKSLPPKVDYILTNQYGEELLHRPFFMDNATIGLIGTEFDNFLTNNKVEWDKELFFNIGTKKFRAPPTTSPLYDAQYIEKLKKIRNDKNNRIYHYNKNTIGMNNEELETFINFEINRLDKEIVYSENGQEYKIPPTSDKNYYTTYLNKLKKVRISGRYFD